VSQLSVNTITNAAGGNTAQINGMTPTADSLQGFRNRILNGGMVIDQRNAGASVTAGSAYTLDRWNVDRVWAGSTVTIQQTSTAPSGFTNSLAATVSTGAAVAAGSYFSIQQFIEGYNIADMALGTASAKQFTVSFWVRSSVTGVFGVGFRNSAFDLSYWTTYTINAANTWEQKSVTIAAPTSGTFGTGNSYGLNVIFSLGCGSTNKAVSNDAWNAGGKLGAVGETDLIATTGATFNITGVQLEAGSVATPFERRPFGTELQLAMRYFETYGGTAAYEPLPAGYAFSTTEGVSNLIFNTVKRAAPTLTVSSASNWAVTNSGGGTIALTALAINGSGTVVSSKSVSLRWTVASGMVAGNGTELLANNTTSARINFSAEL
jgi:hypothetical protein